MKAWVLFLSLTTSGLCAHADESNCSAHLDESSPHSTYLVYYDTARASTRDEMTDDLARRYAAEYKVFEEKNLLPFLRKQFPSAVNRIELFAYPNENMVAVTFPEDRTPIFASMKMFESWRLDGITKVVVHPKDALYAEPVRPADEPAEFRDFMLIYQSPLAAAADDRALETLSADFIAKDLKPWLMRTFPDLADQIQVKAFPLIQSVNVRFPEEAIPSVDKMRGLEGASFSTVPSLEVFNGP